jgi:ATP-dependent RNA helicase DeaD
MTDIEALVGPALALALEKKGYATLTPVQEAVLGPAQEGRDMRISSKTGSGKTLAIGFLLRDAVLARVAEGGRPKPAALVVEPTRELAKQVEAELRWLFAEVPARVVSLTGGASYRDELRSLAEGPAIVVGTPGRLLDHLKRKSVNATEVGTIVLDEADRMLDMGFKDELEEIFEFAQEGHRTHLVSATFPREVKALADKIQTAPINVEGTPLGEANADIDHVIYLVDQRERLAAIINLMIATPEGQTLIFARTRADVASLSRALQTAGFRVDTLSGDLEQNARNRAIAAFKRGDLDAMVATDVAARGIDISDIARVIHADPPTDADTYTHRSGRTGRAGKKGESALIVVPPALARTQFLLRRCGIQARFAAVPDAGTLEARADDKILKELTALEPLDHELGDRIWDLSSKLGATGVTRRVVARLLAKVLSKGGVEPRQVRPIAPPDNGRRVNTGPRAEYNDRPAGPMRGQGQGRDYDRAPARSEYNDRAAAPMRGQGRDYDRAPAPARAAYNDRAPAHARADAGGDAGWVPFRVTWGGEHGADARRLLAMMCRRGNVEGRSVGTIKIAPHFSTVYIAESFAASFEQAAAQNDPRNPDVQVRRDGPGGRSAAPSPSRTRPSTHHLAEDAQRSSKHLEDAIEPRASRPRISTRKLPSASDDAEAPAERVSTRKLPAERVSARKLPTERVSSRKLPAERTSARKLPRESMDDALSGDGEVQKPRESRERAPAPAAREERPRFKDRTMPARPGGETRPQVRSVPPSKTPGSGYGREGHARPGDRTSSGGTGGTGGPSRPPRPPFKGKKPKR